MLWVLWLAARAAGVAAALLVLVIGIVAAYGMQVVRKRHNRRDTEPSTYALPSGRSLSFRVCGCTEGYTSTVVYFSGLLGSRHEADPTPVGKTRVIAVDRPGVGRSSPSYRRTYVQFAEDVHKLVTVGMGTPKYGVAGFSSGGPYALACAAMHPEAVPAVALLCSDTEWATAPWSAFNNLHRFIYVTQYIFPFVVHPLVYVASGLALVAMKPKPAANIAEAVRQGVAGSGREVFIERRHWGFELEMVRQPVLVVHGAHDTKVPIAAAERNASRLPKSETIFVAGDHNKVLRREWAATMRKMADLLA